MARSKNVREKYWRLRMWLEVIRTICPLIMICLQVLLIIKLY